MKSLALFLVMIALLGVAAAWMWHSREFSKRMKGALGGAVLIMALASFWLFLLIHCGPQP